MPATAGAGEGGVLLEGHWGHETWFTWKGGPRGKGIGWRTVFRLQKAGLIKDIDPNPWEHKYAITDKGREYLEGL